MHCHASPKGRRIKALIMESPIAATTADAPEAKERMKQFLEGKAKKAGE